MLRGCKKSGVKKIRVHDLRHSHASLLIEMECQPLLIADRLGHEKIQTTLNTYSHLYPNKQAEVAQQLENLINGTTASDSSQMADVANKRKTSGNPYKSRISRDVVTIQTRQTLINFV